MLLSDFKVSLKFEVSECDRDTYGCVVLVERCSDCPGGCHTQEGNDELQLQPWIALSEIVHFKRDDDADLRSLSDQTTETLWLGQSALSILFQRWLTVLASAMLTTSPTLMPLDRRLTATSETAA